MNILFCQAYCQWGYAYYPTKLGPMVPEPGQHLFPELFKLARKAGLPVCAYFSIGIGPHCGWPSRRLAGANMQEYNPFRVPRPRESMDRLALCTNHGVLAPLSGRMDQL